jgi:hypothetical protein
MSVQFKKNIYEPKRTSAKLSFWRKNLTFAVHKIKNV